MSTATDEDLTSTHEPDDDVRPLRDRISENPRPALVWLAGALVLVALEFGRLISGILEFGSALAFVVGGIASIPGWVGGNVAESLGDFAGAIAADVTSLLILAAVAILLREYLPWRLDDVVDTDIGRGQRLRLEFVGLTALFALLAVLIAYTPVGALLRQELGFWVAQMESLASLPTLTSPEVIPNLGHRTPDGGWEGTFLGLSPRAAWAIRFSVVWVYVFTWLVWLWKGYNIYRDHYRAVDWTPRDDVVRRFRNHTWGLFGLFVVIGFVTLAAFAPAVSPVPIDHNVYEPYNHEFEYLNDDGEVETILHGTANLQSQSNGQNTVGLNSYDPYDRYAPLGTTPRGQDMLTTLAYGARTSLVIALTAVFVGAFIAITLSLMTAYYKGILDILVIFASDTIISVPVLVLAMMIVVIFQDSGHPLARPMDGGLLLALILGLAYWPSMWRSIRGPSLQVAEEEWVDAAKSYGQKPTSIMRKHMAPYIASYIIIYASLLIGGVIITVAALTFLGLGINPPTPEWGRLISAGRPYIPTSSWHVSTVSGLMIALVVLAFNALGDAVRDAVDPEADVDEAAGAGGGG